MADPIETHVPNVFDDPSSMLVARAYAEALLKAAGSEAQSVLEELQSFVVDVLRAHPQFDRLLREQLANHDAVVAMLDRVIAPRSSTILTNFLKVLSRHGRLGLVEQVQTEMQLLWEQSVGIERFEVRVARPLTSADEADLRQELIRRTGHEPVLDIQVDPSLLGGLVVRIGDTQFDGSVRTKLKQLRAAVRERYLNEVQRGRDRFSHPAGN
jgi:F-type H+-transporting ATPase subunit delta